MIQKLPRFITCLFVLICATTGAFAQQRGFIRGQVLDYLSGEGLPGAAISIDYGQEGALTDADGNYIYPLPAGEYQLTASYTGYEPQRKAIRLERGDTLIIDFALKWFTLPTVEITDFQNQSLESAAMANTNLSMQTIAAMPAFLGEVDLLKSIQLLPGIQGAGEGNAGFFVRGGSADQNLILLDDAVVYNASHLLGFFSVFNGDAIEDVTLYTGVMPAQYGERLASVIDVTQRSGDMQQLKGRGGIGLISSRLTIDGPIKKGKASYLISGRRTYIDALAKPFLNPNSAFGGSAYHFFDVNGRVDWKLKKGNSIYLSAYTGDDVFDFNSAQSEFKSAVSWGNRLVSAGYQKAFSKGVFKLNGSLTRYSFQFNGAQDDFEIEVKSRIRDLRLKPELIYQAGKHQLRVGALYTHHKVNPNNSDASQGETVFDLGEKQVLYGHESAVYASDAFDISERWRVEAGVRFSFYQQVGPFTRYVLNDAGLKEDTIVYPKGQVIADYQGFEPRLMLRYRLSERSALKAGFTQNYQYIQQATLSPIGLPTDVWLASTSLIKPQIGRQYAIGYFTQSPGGIITASVEAYYKDMENLVEYKENTQPSDGVDNNEDNLLTFGDGRAYGAEFLLRKNTGKLQGWLAYTWSKSERQFDELNKGDWYYANFDRRHDLALVVIYQKNDRWSFSGNFVFGSGRAISLPQNSYFIEGRLVYEYGARNSFRMRDYHRLDLSATLHGKKTRTEIMPDTSELIERPKRVRSSWVFSIYNVYSRLNPYFYYFDTQGQAADNNFKVQAKQVSLFPILPSVTWNFAF